MVLWLRGLINTDDTTEEYCKHLVMKRVFIIRSLYVPFHTREISWFCKWVLFRLYLDSKKLFTLKANSSSRKALPNHSLTLSLFSSPSRLFSPSNLLYLSLASCFWSASCQHKASNEHAGVCMTRAVCWFVCACAYLGCVCMACIQVSREDLCDCCQLCSTIWGLGYD